MNAHTSTAQFALASTADRAPNFGDALVKHACAFSALVAATTSKSGKVSKAVEQKYDDATDRLCSTQAIEPIHTAYKLGAAYDLIETGDGSSLSKELALDIVQDDTREVAERLIASAWLDMMAEDNRRRADEAAAALPTQNSGRLDRPVLDDDAAEYTSSRENLAAIARMAHDDPAQESQPAEIDRCDAALTRMLQSAPTSLAGVEVRLRAILENAWNIDLDRGTEHSGYPSKALTAEDLYGEYGCGTNDTEVIGSALARLHWGVASLVDSFDDRTPASDHAQIAHCPAALLAPQLDAMLVEEDAALEAATVARQAGDMLEAERQESRATALSNDRYTLEEKASNLRATTLKGAALQMALAMHAAELTRGCHSQDARDQHHTMLEGHLNSALHVLGEHISTECWKSYIGGDRPAGDEINTHGHHANAAWQSARLAFLSAQARWLEIGDANTPESEQAFTDQLAAEMSYAQTPPPNLHSLATMMRDVLNFDALPGNDDRADKRESIQKLLNDDEPGLNYLAMVYQHATRLVGEVGEIHEARRPGPTQRGLTDEEFNARFPAQSAAA